MGEKFADTYRIRSSRLQNWDYGWRGQYYITLCTRERECYFGEIIDGQMKLSGIGEIARSEWFKTPEIRPDMNLELDEFVIMPNHIHGIIQIGKNEYNTFDEKDYIDCGGRRDAMHGVSTAMHGVSTSGTTDGGLLQKGNNKPGPQRKNLSSIIRGFKSAVTTEARMINADFGWQSRFYERIIRDEGFLNNIRRYIKENPGKWKIDELNSEN